MSASLQLVEPMSKAAIYKYITSPSILPAEDNFETKYPLKMKLATTLTGIVASGAVFSSFDIHRYVLFRIWDPSLPSLNVIGLNPSTADADFDDPTIRRCVDFARRWGHGGLVMTNIFSYRATDPEVMKGRGSPSGDYNDLMLIGCTQVADRVLAAWGTHGAYRDRGSVVTDTLRNSVDLYCLGQTRGGFPKHPLYIKRSTIPEIYRRKIIRGSE